MIENFKGKTLVISGATRGIGKAILYRFAQNGVNIAFTYNKNEEEALKIIADVETKYKIKAKAYPLNVLEPETYKELFAKIDEDFDLYTMIELKNKKPIAMEYKNIKLLGDKVQIQVADNKRAQDLWYFALGVGLGEMNARGCGFLNYRWL